MIITKASFKILPVAVATVAATTAALSSCQKDDGEIIQPQEYCFLKPDSAQYTFSDSIINLYQHQIDSIKNANQ